VTRPLGLRELFGPPHPPPAGARQLPCRGVYARNSRVAGAVRTA